jgi:hypothetical protein
VRVGRQIQLEFAWCSVTHATLAPPMLDLVVRGCLAKDPAERIQSAHDVAMELRWITSLRAAPAVAEPGWARWIRATPAQATDPLSGE